MLKRREESDTYLNNVCRHPHSGEPGEKFKYEELSVNTTAFFSYRWRLTKLLAGATRGKKGSKGGGGQVRLSSVDAGKLTGFKYKLILHFPLVSPANTLVSLHL
jgi:hypothetical protein